MIYYLVPAKFRDHSIDSFLAAWGKSLKGRLVPLTYQELFRTRILKPGVMIFTHLEGLSLPERKLVRSFYARHASSRGAFHLLNDPSRVLDRYDLGVRLHEAGINRFRPRYLNEDLSSIRFPAFVRLVHEHGFWSSRLAHNAADLTESIRSLKEKAPGLRPREAIVSEFCDVSEGGLFRKYSALRIGDEIIPRHILFSSKWMTKYPDLVDADKAAEELDFVRNFGHADRLRPVFDLAGIEYGRIDYGFQEGRLCVWEINTNPVIVPPPEEIHSDRKESQTESAHRIVDAFDRLGRKVSAADAVKLWRWFDRPRRRKARRAGKRHIRDRDHLIDRLTGAPISPDASS